MSHYLDDPELTAETIVDGWLLTGDLGRFDSSGHLQLFGRKKNMIVTEGGKNIYPEDIETVFDGIAGRRSTASSRPTISGRQKPLAKRCWFWCCGWSQDRKGKCWNSAKR